MNYFSADSFDIKIYKGICWVKRSLLHLTCREGEGFYSGLQWTNKSLTGMKLCQHCLTLQCTVSNFDFTPIISHSVHKIMMVVTYHVIHSIRVPVS